MSGSFALIVALIAVALIFDFLNGLHDAANSIATVVSTRVLSPEVAVVWAAFFNFIAFLFFGLHVAQTIGTGLIAPDVVDWRVIFGALMGAIVWNLMTWWGAIPSSSSHALIGGLGRRRDGQGGISAVVWPGTAQDGRRDRVVAAARLRAGARSVAGGGVALHAQHALCRGQEVSRDAARFSAALYSIGHGANDAQKTMGIIAGLLFAEGLLGSDFYVPFWVVLSCQAAMALGTLIGGWRIVKTMGSRITRLKPVQGFCAETAGAATLYLATSFGVPVSTTHTITGAIVGVGAARRVSAVRWGIAGSIIIAWVVTLPAAALIAAVFYACATLLSRLVQQVGSADFRECRLARAPARDNVGERNLPLDLLPQLRRAGENVDRHLVVLVFVRRLAPFEPVRREPKALAHQGDAGLDRLESFPDVTWI